MSKDSRGSAENFVVFGTAFPETTEKDRRAGRSDAGQFVPVWKQEARDEKGRRRFHGAFTGGFSAGYFNTVGSKEGWEPSNYVSSRTARNERKEARPEDFMDEEDLEAMAGARKLVATEEFDILGGTERELAARRKQQQEEEERGGGLSFFDTSLIDMFGPPKDSVGVRLLRKMGWRPGQGIGPRMKRRLSNDDDDGDAFGQDITFAPRDTPIENFQAKRDTYGLGYDLSASVPEVAEMKRLRELARQKAMDTDSKNRASFGVVDKNGRKTEAFGLGAYEVDDEDEDVYRNESTMTNYHSALYDDNEGGLTQDELKRQTMKRKHQEESSTIKNLLKCSDGRPPLKGFHVSDQKQEIGKWHAPPQIPADYTGQHIVSANTNTLKSTVINKESIFSFEERGNVLGEKPIEQRSVFEYMPKHSKDKLDQAVNWFIDSGKDKSQLSEFPSVPKDVAQLALKGFMPFGDQLQKQARYRDYLENQAGLLSEDGVPKKVLPIPEGLTYEAGMKEMDEFAKAARIFRPISAMMSGRFTSASEPKHVEVVNFEGGLKTEEQYRKEKEQRAKETLEPEKKELTQEAEAAAMKMFGNLTRTVKPFYPNRLVCKRFNVRNPHPDHDPTTDKAAGRTQAGSKDALNKESMESILNERMPLKFTSSSNTTSKPLLISSTDNDPMMKAVVPKPSERAVDDKDTKSPMIGVDVIKKEEDEDEGGPPLDYERPSMDIFKAIFDDSDTEDEEEKETEQEIKQEHQTVITAPQINHQDNFIGPPAPPPVSTADIPMTVVKDTSSNVETPFRPMFKRASERKEPSNSLTHVISEEVVVQPFKPRSSGHKRRHVSVSEDEDDDHKTTKRRDSSNDHRKRSERDKDEPDRRSRHRHHHKHKSHSKRKRSKSRDRSDSRERRSSRHKSDRRDKKSSRRRRDKYDQDEYEDACMWVEKEPPVVIQTTATGQGKKGGRMSAADMW